MALLHLPSWWWKRLDRANHRKLVNTHFVAYLFVQNLDQKAQWNRIRERGILHLGDEHKFHEERVENYILALVIEIS